MDEYIYRISAHNDSITRATGKRPRYFIRTYGCQMNVRESEKLAGTLAVMGYDHAASETDADLVLYNTCCVRENAENKIFGNLSYLKFQKESNPQLTIVLCGCMVRQDSVLSQIKAKHGYVDVVFGTANRRHFPSLLYKHIETGRPVIDIDDTPEPENESTADEAVLTSRGHAYKAGVNVMYGCDNFCAYCIVPYVRGRERSRTPEDILAEVKTLADDGVKEVMLLGQNVNSYGAGGKDLFSFASLLRRVNAVPGLARIRFMTSHPKDFSDDLIAAISECDKVCKAVHLPLQSGSTRVLAAMNRRYTKENYLSLAERLQNAIPGIALSTDIIVGFPGETEADFEDTLEVARHIRFAGAFTFLYSKRTGTPAADMPGEVSEPVMAERFKRLIEVINPFILARNEARIGQVVSVMAEDDKPGKGGTLTGRADDNTLVHFYGDNIKPGDVVNVRVTEAKTFYLTGRVI